AAEPANPETVQAARPLLPARPQQLPAEPGRVPEAQQDRQLPRAPQVPHVPRVPHVPQAPRVPPPQRVPAVPAVTPVAPDPRRPPSAVTAIGSGPNERAADLAAHILPLGTGFALMGLGLGYLGMRLRKGL
ncbi:hypothetical protein ACFXA3_30220, partial [Streptomyces sp. NPDC059456]